MDDASWVADFYSATDRWWGNAEATIDDVDLFRLSLVAEFASAGASVLELGCGYGTTAAAIAAAGFAVTAIDLSNRIDRAPRIGGATAMVSFVKADFFEHDFGRTFDVVCYWDGFGVGSDSHQRQLLERVRSDWLSPAGFALIEVYEPTGWQADHGLLETKHAEPDSGYDYTLGHSRAFDARSSTAVDTWWELDIANSPRWSQYLRCYSPSDFETLAVDADLRVDQFLDAGRTDWSYLTLLRPTSSHL